MRLERRAEYVEKKARKNQKAALRLGPEARAGRLVSSTLAKPIEPIDTRKIVAERAGAVPPCPRPGARGEAPPVLKFAGVIPDLFGARRESIGWLLSNHDFRLRQISAHPCERFNVYVWSRGGCCVSVAVGYDATTTGL